MKSDSTFQNNGCFTLPSMIVGRSLICIASDGLGWEHVSCHVERGREMSTPLWKEMCQLKNIFWDEEDVVMQLHPKQSQYVNVHPHTLHLWRPVGIEIPSPPSIMVG